MPLSFVIIYVIETGARYVVCFRMPPFPSYPFMNARHTAAINPYMLYPYYRPATAESSSSSSSPNSSCDGSKASSAAHNTNNNNASQSRAVADWSGQQPVTANGSNCHTNGFAAPYAAAYPSYYKFSYDNSHNNPYQTSSQYEYPSTQCTPNTDYYTHRLGYEWNMPQWRESQPAPVQFSHLHPDVRATHGAALTTPDDPASPDYTT